MYKTPYPEVETANTNLTDSFTSKHILKWNWFQVFSTVWLPAMYFARSSYQKFLYLIPARSLWWQEGHRTSCAIRTYSHRYWGHCPCIQSSQKTRNNTGKKPTSRFLTRYWDHIINNCESPLLMRLLIYFVIVHTLVWIIPGLCRLRSVTIWCISNLRSRSILPSTISSVISVPVLPIPALQCTNIGPPLCSSCITRIN